MEDNDLGSKKMNNKQNDNEDINDLTHTNSPLNPEIEIDQFGNKKVVERARFTDHDDATREPSTDKNISSKPSTASEKEGKKMTENRDKNSDIASNRKTESDSKNYNVD
jgi:hypothetical protein